MVWLFYPICMAYQKQPEVINIIDDHMSSNALKRRLFNGKDTMGKSSSRYPTTHISASRLAKICGSHLLDNTNISSILNAEMQYLKL